MRLQLSCVEHKKQYYTEPLTNVYLHRVHGVSLALMAHGTSTPHWYPRWQGQGLWLSWSKIPAHHLVQWVIKVSLA